MIRNPTQHRHLRGGYVLLVVIAVSVLVITTLASLAKVSLRRGLDAADAERALQSRWGSLTLERAVSRKMPKVFDEQEKMYAEKSPGTPPPSTIRAAITLSGVTYDLLLGDEDAKLNINSLYHHAGQNKTEQAIGRIVGSLAPGTLRMTPVIAPLEISREKRKLATKDDDDEEESSQETLPDAFRSWGEVFDVNQLELQTGSPVVLPNITTGITLWGNGPLNIRRASDDAIIAVVGSVIQDSGARKFVKRIRKNPNLALGVILQAEISDEQKRGEVTRLISEASTNYSIWIDASTRSGGRMTTFASTRRDDEGVTRHVRFAY